MAERVVEVVEAVDVEQQHADRAVLEHRLHPGGEQGPVGQAGQRVVQGLVLALLRGVPHLVEQPGLGEAAAAAVAASAVASARSRAPNGPALHHQGAVTERDHQRVARLDPHLPAGDGQPAPDRATTSAGASGAGGRPGSRSPATASCRSWSAGGAGTGGQHQVDAVGLQGGADLRQDGRERVVGGRARRERVGAPQHQTALHVRGPLLLRDRTLAPEQQRQHRREGCHPDQQRVVHPPLSAAGSARPHVPAGDKRLRSGAAGCGPPPP